MVKVAMYTKYLKVDIASKLCLVVYFSIKCFFFLMFLWVVEKILFGKGDCSIHLLENKCSNKEAARLLDTSSKQG